MSINLSWNKVRGCHCPQWSGRNTTGSAASTLWPLAVKWCSHLSWLSKAMHCSVPAEISFQSGNFRYFSFWSQKQNPTSGLYLMAPWDTHAHVILSYIITACLHMCFSIQDYSPFSFKICCACSWVSQGGCFQVVCEWHCWLWLNTRPQALGSGQRACRAQQANLSTVWPSASQCFLILLLKEASDRFCLQTPWADCGMMGRCNLAFWVLGLHYFFVLF